MAYMSTLVYLYGILVHMEEHGDSVTSEPTALQIDMTDDEQPKHLVFSKINGKILFSVFDKDTCRCSRAGIFNLEDTGSIYRELQEEPYEMMLFYGPDPIISFKKGEWYIGH